MPWINVRLKIKDWSYELLAVWSLIRPIYRSCRFVNIRSKQQGQLYKFIMISTYVWDENMEVRGRPKVIRLGCGFFSNFVKTRAKLRFRFGFGFVKTDPQFWFGFSYSNCFQPNPSLTHFNDEEVIISVICG